MSEKHTDDSYLMQGVQELFRTQGPMQHFFGYYDKSPFDNEGCRILCHRVDINGRLVEKGDTAEIGYWDINTGKYHQIAETSSYNWQQGSMLQWMPPDYSKRIIFNNCLDDNYCAVIADTATGAMRALPTTIYSLSPNGTYAVTPNHCRHYFCRRGYSYRNICDPKWNHKAPEGDGIHLVNLDKGTERMIITTQEIMERSRLRSMDEGNNYLEHMMFNSNGSRFVFMHRWGLADGGIATRLYVAGINGENIHHFPDSKYYGHGCWRTNSEYLIYGSMISGFSRFRHSKSALRLLLRPLLKLNRALPRTKAIVKARSRFASKGLLLLHDGSSEAQMVENRLIREDGHPSVRPGKPNHILIDTYPDSSCRQKLMVYDMDGKRLIELADLYCPKEFHAKGYRCDLHPRWDRTGNRICVDSLQDRTRQMYVYNVNEALKAID